MNETRTDDARAERIAAMQRITMASRLETHEKIAAQKAAAMDGRCALAASYLEQHPGGFVVPPERAVATMALVDETAGARAEAAAVAAGRTTDVNNGALEFPALGHEFANGSDVIRFGTTPLILAPVVRYLGMMPILFNLFVTRAYTTTFLPGTAHRFHLDPEDIRSFKVFVHLTDVDDDCGPFHALPADRSATVLEAVDYRGITMLDDEKIADLVGWDAVVKVTGPPGMVAMADTTRCLHFGGRPRAAGKPVREMLVYQYLLPTSVILTGEGADAPRRFLPQLEPTGEPWWDALIGATLT